MDLFGKKDRQTMESLEDSRERLVVEEEIATREASIAERRAVIKQLEKNYGPRWKSILGLGGRIDLQTLRSVLVGMKRGLMETNKSLPNPGLSPLPSKNLRR